MENAAEALRMAGGVLIFVLALTISINAFTQSRQGIDNLVLYGDREFLSTYVKQNKGTKRIVGAESIVPTIYRAYKENIKINFKFLEKDTSKDGLYTKRTVDGVQKITFIDLQNETQGNEDLKDFFIKNILFGSENAVSLYTNKDEYNLYKSMISKDITFDKYNGLYYRLSTGDLSKETYEESLGVYFPGEVQGTTDKSTINKTEKKVITYDIAN